MTQRHGPRAGSRSRLAIPVVLAVAMGAGGATAQRANIAPEGGRALPSLLLQVQGWGIPGGIAVPLDLAEASAAPALSVGAVVKLDLARGQSAFFRLPEGADLEALTRSLARGTDTVMALLDRQGRLLSEDDDGGEESLASRIDVAADQGGPLFLRVGVLEQAGGQFELVLRAAPSADPTGAPRSLTEAATQHPLAIGQAVTIRLRGRDEAYFRLPAGGQDLVVLTRNLSAGTDTTLALLDANGRDLSEDDDGGDEQLSSRIEVPGGQRRPLYVRARVLGTAGAFELVVMPDTSPPAPPFPASLREATAAPALVVGQAMPLRLRRGQSAVYRLPEGDIAVITRALRRGADTVLALLDADGNVMSEDDDGGGGLASRLEVAGTEPRPLFVRAGMLGDAGGEFELLVEADLQGPADFPTSLSAAAAGRAIDTGAPVAIRLRRGQSAFFRLPPGALTVYTQALRDGTDTILEILDESGRVLAEDDDGGSGLASRLVVDAARKGDVFVRAGVLGAGPGVFELVVAPAGRR
ncbi:hypothetical protein [Roseomonas sp. CECT 9278]|uniref:hypothetical protein n=1 Tax=Roseomonas sp. CECT 9278 TaxID=2845823 RepID=UPI001E3A581F|nr:hypothetical protein [Roseomonas sp. CECT 9278]CAH0168529.1 hypothetical protein ROS9278_01136 [Roseomonas sp. CECT 9278]